jgi:serine/threonine protein kinase
VNDYFISGSDLKLLYNQFFRLRNLSGQEAEFSIPQPAPGWPRTGLEAYGLLVDCKHPSRGNVPSFLKIFKMEIPYRAKRSEYLIKTGLARHHPWLFQGMPYVAMDGFTINGIRVVGHIAQQIRGNNGFTAEDLSRLRNNNSWKPTQTERKRAAGHLCCAVAALEELEIVHGDISSRNVIIGAAPDGKVAAILCDYDGFYQPKQPLLPLQYNNTPCRPIGSAGYQYPQVVADLTANKADVAVKTDRFALAVLACELMVWDESVTQELGREELLTNEIIQKCDLTPLPVKIRNKWKEGFDLLQDALRAKDIAEMPSPAAWLDILKGLPSITVPFTGRPQVNVSRRKGSPVLIGKVNLVNPHGSFAPLHPDLRALEFSAPPAALHLKIQWGFPVLLRRNGRLTSLGNGPRTLSLQPGDVVTSNQWEFEVLDSQHP